MLEPAYTCLPILNDVDLSQAIPAQLKNKTVAQVIATFFVPPVGALIAAMVSTFGLLLANFHLQRS